ncbi:MAG TPA: 23S rRNA (pseudouridine(1915)-N(3))-methyltransferase RlmH [Thermoleophilaceae bacterium]|jgi:23S rRNA (pseudouridine1915-N3)-methyltransferase|nr:23S rRNA (pseudouridine(1915)-N(3))-methyltransferase RlmH [Thermoleophilaceae bacterium]
MRITLIAVGRLRPPFQDDVEHYRKLLAGLARVELIEVREDERVPKRIPERAHLVLLASDGREFDSIELSRWLEDRRQEGRDLCFVVGGPKGLDLDRCDTRLSLGRLTLPHQLARVVLLEQLYRAHKILAGEPYHY